jgi:hypothetical protein
VASRRFDVLTRRLMDAISRRDALRALAAATAVLALPIDGDAAAKHKKHKSKCKPPCGAGMLCVNGVCVVGQGTCATGSSVCLGQGDGACGLQAASDQCQCQVSAEGQTRCADKTAIEGAACGECAKSADCRRLYPAVAGVFCLKAAKNPNACCPPGKRSICAAPCPTPPACAAPDDCHDTLDICEQHVCVNGRCGKEVVPDGTPAPASQQTLGDCQIVVCTGQGPHDTRSDPDDTDVPAAPGDCFIAMCDDGEPDLIPRQAGFPCAGGTCDGAGNCTPSGSSEARTSGTDGRGGHKTAHGSRSGARQSTGG